MRCMQGTAYEADALRRRELLRRLSLPSSVLAAVFAVWCAGQGAWGSFALNATCGRRFDDARAARRGARALDRA